MEELFDKKEFEYFIPGIYSDHDAAAVAKFKEEIGKIAARGPVDPADLVAGKCDGLPGVSGPVEISGKLMKAMADNYIAENPLFNDEEYAKKAGYESVPAYYFINEPNYMPAMPMGQYLGDCMLVSGHNDMMNYYKPVYEGDKLWTVIDWQDCEDITPLAGSHYRTWALSGQAKVYNQKGELVAEGANILKESFRRHKDPAKQTAMRAWESPDWWHQRPHYVYTDADWEYIKDLWKKETVRGSEPLYWDDVEVGTEVVTSVGGPVLIDQESDIVFHLPKWAAETKVNMLDPEKFKDMVKDEHNLYYPKDHAVKKPGKVFKMSILDDEDDGKEKPEAAKAHDMPEMPPEVANRDGRSVIQNAVCTKWAATAIINWMGDAGWLRTIAWDIMSTPPGYDATVIPHFTKKPELFNLFPYLAKVPGMEGKRADCHAMEYDTIVTHAYVTDKYEKDGEYLVDLTWWCETIDHYLVQEGGATVVLPKK
ncbi:MAG: hypothetical protein E7430_06535 [Ruminococcaceae bacterium]|nr:hypothetical protein [Oscillospiraceae bacterium]